MESTEWLPVAAIEARFRAIVAEGCHLKNNLPPDSPHNAILRLIDIAAYIGHGRMDAGYARRHQRELSLFFKALDHGHLVKARLGDKWQILSRHSGHQALAQMDAAPLAKQPREPLKCKIDLTTLGPRLSLTR